MRPGCLVARRILDDRERSLRDRRGGRGVAGVTPGRRPIAKGLTVLSFHRVVDVPRRRARCGVAELRQLQGLVARGTRFRTDLDPVDLLASAAVPTFDEGTADHVPVTEELWRRRIPAVELTLRRGWVTGANAGGRLPPAMASQATARRSSPGVSGRTFAARRVACSWRLDRETYARARPRRTARGRQVAGGRESRPHRAGFLLYGLNANGRPPPSRGPCE